MGRAVITGDRQLERALSRLADKSADRVASAAIRGGLRAIVLAAKKDAPVGPTGNLRKSIRSRFERSRYTGKLSAKAGLNVGKRAKLEDGSRIGARAPHAHLVALGTKQRAHKSGKSTGTMPANPFMRLAVASSISAQKALMKQRAAKALDRESRKAKKG